MRPIEEIRKEFEQAQAEHIKALELVSSVAKLRDRAVLLKRELRAATAAAPAPKMKEGELSQRKLRALEKQGKESNDGRRK